MNLCKPWSVPPWLQNKLLWAAAFLKSNLWVWNMDTVMASSSHCINTQFPAQMCAPPTYSLQAHSSRPLPLFFQISQFLSTCFPMFSSPQVVCVPGVCLGEPWKSTCRSNKAWSWKTRRMGEGRALSSHCLPSSSLTVPCLPQAPGSRSWETKVLQILSPIERRSGLQTIVNLACQLNARPLRDRYTLRALRREINPNEP